MAEPKTKDLLQRDLQNRLQKVEGSDLRDNEEVQKILQNAKERYQIFDLCGVPVRVVCAFPREVRYIYEKNRKRDPNTPIEFSEVEQENYKVMSMFFLDPPYNTPEFWELFDSDNGMMWGHLNAVYEGIEESERRIGSFRKK